MKTSDDILISVEERHAINLISGSKKVEFRRRKMNLCEGDRVWIYSKVPRGQVDAIGIVDHVFSGTPEDIWGCFSSSAGIDEREFFEYYSDLDVGYVIVFSEVRQLPGGVRLEDIRKHHERFQPPQFFQRLSSCSPVLRLFEDAFA